MLLLNKANEMKLCIVTKIEQHQSNEINGQGDINSFMSQDTEQMIISEFTFRTDI